MFTHLTHGATGAEYEEQAAALLRAWQDGDEEAVRLFRSRHPRFLDPKVPWKPREMSDEEARAEVIDLDDARLAIARWYDFADWARLLEFATAASEPASPVARFESAVDAVVTGDLSRLAAMLGEDPALAHARSARITHFDPPVHRATLLHYVAANGVEGYRQKTPPNAVEVARVLLEGGADPNALADLYGGECTTMSLLVSSSHPAEAGVQVALVNLLLDYGAAVGPTGKGSWTSPVMTALVFGYTDAALALVGRGAGIDSIVAAAGLGRADDVRMLLPLSDPVARHQALAIAAINGQTEVVGVLLDAGEDPNRLNPGGFHAHSTPLHQAALAGREDLVRLLIDRGARLDMRDTLWDGTPLGWAEHGGQTEVAAWLRARGMRR
jgi:ankyrin repeat protein